MTVSNENNQSGPYTGNGITTVFAYGFRILDPSHIQVVRTDSGRNTVLTTGFTVSGVGNANGGSVTFETAPTAGQKITIIRKVPFIQQTDLENQGAYYAEVVEQAFDLAVMRDQQLQQQINQTLKIPVGQNASKLDELIEDVIKISQKADAIDAVAEIKPQVDAVAGIKSQVVVVAEAASDVAIVANNLVDVTNFSDVYLGSKNVEPTVRNDNSPLQLGDLYFNTVKNVMKVRAAIAWVDVSPSTTNLLTPYIYTATSGQTVFAATYNVGFVQVYLNGVKLLADKDFTATNGRSITLATGAKEGDRVEIVCFASFVMADVLQKSHNGSDILDKPKFMNNLGISDYAQKLINSKTTEDFLAKIDAVRHGTVTLDDFSDNQLRKSDKGFENLHDKELTTSAWVKTYRDRLIKAKLSFDCSKLRIIYIEGLSLSVSFPGDYSLKFNTPQPNKDYLVLASVAHPYELMMNEAFVANVYDKTDTYFNIIVTRFIVETLNFENRGILDLIVI